MDYSDLSLYDYRLPPELIAQRPAVPRDSAKMLVYCRGSRVAGRESFMADSTFNKLSEYLDENCVLVCNNTKVIPARIWGNRKTGGKVELLFVEHLTDKKYKVMLSRFIRSGEVLVLEGTMAVTVVSQAEKYFTVEVPVGHIEFVKYLTKHGTMPIPPYINHPDSRSKLTKEYQTVFAKHEGSVAAPTASLHFTQRLLQRLRSKGVSIIYVTLHVGLGTFAPLTEDNFRTGTLHGEQYEVSKESWDLIMQARNEGKKIIAAGTTAVRVLETVAATRQLIGSTNLFIMPPYSFRIVGGMITNFHLPRTSLLMLVSALIGDRKQTLELYEHAIAEKYRFYSFGDGMLIL